MEWVQVLKEESVKREKQDYYLAAIALAVHRSPFLKHPGRYQLDDFLFKFDEDADEVVTPGPLDENEDEDEDSQITTIRKSRLQQMKEQVFSWVGLNRGGGSK